ncbi:hypothetical protein [Moorena sp. SIO3A2]|uniref:HEAT repeat domain-containing protein n=1 Tax=Moorena sp. SIO3A2 TaxID=2607841 RepID=UPI0013B9CF6B|nr:hypothetical protein [Moorena sp. SIO3A2]NER91543.1 hypothetical protein [Moorena sp. SIO3A2]
MANLVIYIPLSIPPSIPPCLPPCLDPFAEFTLGPCEAVIIDYSKLNDDNSWFWELSDSNKFISELFIDLTPLLQKVWNIENFKLNDDNFWERVDEIITQAAIEPLIKCLDKDKYSVCIRAAEALIKIGTQATISKLINPLNNKELGGSGYNYVFKETIIDDLTVRCTNSSIIPTVCRQLSYFLDGLSTIIVRLLIGQSMIFDCLKPLPFKYFSSLAFFDSS